VVNLSLVVLPSHNPQEAPGVEIVWQDPATGESFVIDSRTENSFCQIGHDPRQSRIEDPQFTNVDREARRTLGKQKTNNMAIMTNSSNHADVPAWLERALQVSALI